MVAALAWNILINSCEMDYSHKWFTAASVLCLPKLQTAEILSSLQVLSIWYSNDILCFCGLFYVTIVKTPLLCLQCFSTITYCTYNILQRVYVTLLSLERPRPLLGEISSVIVPSGIMPRSCCVAWNKKTNRNK